MAQYAYLPEQHEAVAAQPFLFGGKTYLRGEPFEVKLPEIELRGLYLADLVEFMPPGELLDPRCFDTPVARRLGMKIEDQNHPALLAERPDKPKPFVDPDELESPNDLADLAQFRRFDTPQQTRVDAMKAGRGHAIGKKKQEEARKAAAVEAEAKNDL